MSMSNLLFCQHIFLETSNVSEQDSLHHVFRRKCETTLACNFFLNVVLPGVQLSCSSEYRHDPSEKSILFPTSYFIVSKRWLIKDWMTPKKKIIFSFTTSHTCDVTCPGSQRFQNGRQLSTKKKLSKIWFCTNHLLFAHLGFLNSGGICWYNKKKGKNLKSITL